MQPATDVSGPSRYRVEHGEPCIDVRVGQIEQLFDYRDPAPFRGRDLDPGLVEYLTDAGEDLVRHETFRIVFWLESECAKPAEIEAAVRSHFEYVLDRIRRRRREHRRAGHAALVIAIVALAGLLSLAQLIASAIPGSLGAGLKEGLIILAWILMWRPIEVLVFDGIPVRRERKVMSKLLAAPIEVRVAEGPVVPAPARFGPDKPFHPTPVESPPASSAPNT